MKLSRSMTLAAGLVAAVGFSGPASADFWWETETEALYWDGAVDSYGVFRYLLRDQNYTMDKTITYFIDDLGPLYSSGGSIAGTHGGLWFRYGDASKKCGFEMEDPYGVASNNWGSFEIQIARDENSFTMNGTSCEDDRDAFVLKGTEGLVK
jgi:hypothetical protein